MHGLQQILATVEEFCLWPLDLIGKVRGQVLVNNPVGTSEETQDPLDEMLLALRKGCVVLEVLGGIHLLWDPPHSD